MLAVASKQTMAPVAIALAFFVLLVEGRCAFLRYVAVQLAASAAIFLAMLAAFRPPRDLLFNTFTLAWKQPRTVSVAGRMMDGLFQMRSELAAGTVPLLVLLALFALSPGAWRENLVKHRWTVFLWLAAFQLPVELRAWSTAGGDRNHLGVVTLFTALAITCGCVELWKEVGNDPRQWTGWIARALLVGVLLANFPLPYQLFQDLTLVRTNATEVAYNYERQHPGRAYFPVNPLAVFLADGKLTHFDDALFDRELAGFPIDAKQLAAGLPAAYELVAYPPGDDVHAAVLRALLAGKPLVQEPELKGWTVYRVAPPAIRSASVSPP
jgi:hypothetical protein